MSTIADNVSVFNCLICDTTSLTINICALCYTTGVAATSHPHDISFLITDSDFLIQEGASGIPPHLWTVRKNASGRLWYTHNETGFRTHIRPMTAAVHDAELTATGLPPGWEQKASNQGNAWYLNTITNAWSWDKPNNVLPPGWIIRKTPDGAPFFVHEALQLATWDRPGEPPKTRPNAAGSTNGKVAKGAVTASDVKTAVSVASNIAKLSAAADLSPAGIITASVAAAKLTALGVKIAGKRIGKFGKGKRLASATKFLGAAAQLAGDDDGGDVDFDEGDEDGDEDVEEEETQPAAYESQPTGETDACGLVQQDTVPGVAEQSYAEQPYVEQPYVEQPYVEQPYVEQPYTEQPYTEQPQRYQDPQYYCPPEQPQQPEYTYAPQQPVADEPYYYPQGPQTYVYNDPPSTTFEATYPPQEPPAPVVNNTYIVVVDVDVGMQTTTITELDSTTPAETGQVPIPQGPSAVITDFSWQDPLLLPIQDNEPQPPCR
ncbi:hypothetical protein B0T24DRAFT_708510 [Lasiosphaeria ovina]|uniref:WW domain-containing protein n=1 Tax=Lasiosphaeria ovina TaxID=92902 RepID=A0AAE0K3Y2_9PEZI|nr:hypothetical protein B0T24DRAFT_708510 [Lasiosphaeria ovina]